ncbi:FRE7 [Candida margitis]|uniref:FRE7 n=1 Tax=Candida margitis TaxID=1775924 RepID=UPI002228077F|nr:FRE7 [Candida margitis]KAI5970813.1 FRE7 [Candida margitis]
MMKRNVEYKGLDCAADTMDPIYMQYKMLSQQQIPWASQTKYAKYTVYFGVVIIFIALLKHLYYCVRDKTFKPKSNTNTAVSLVDVLISYCRFVGYKQTPMQLQYFCSFPKSVGAALFMSLSTLYLACYCFVPHYWYRPCIGFGSPPLAIRAGLMATALMPFIYILSGKSNIITLLTGISYEKLNTYHQYFGVAAFVLSIVHTVPFIYQFLQESGAAYMHDRFMSKQIYISAIPSLILLGLLCTLSKAWFRKHCYEAFLH